MGLNRMSSQTIPNKSEKKNPQEYAQFNKPPSSYIVVFTYFGHSVEPLKPAFFQ